ncbi:hypothetical protein ACFSTH_07135 [Paenibacillus yanchengensis]|uniref:Uncharacterized protein n=1 Tax=Paenibacillus yanchengensis TaxID=2035833 RepID=A0ABW4YHQ2_9BACL
MKVIRIKYHSEKNKRIMPQPGAEILTVLGCLTFLDSVPSL